MALKHTSLFAWTASLMLIILWFAGMSASSTYDGLLHLLLIPAMVTASVEFGRTTRSEKVMAQ